MRSFHSMVKDEEVGTRMADLHSRCSMRESRTQSCSLVARAAPEVRRSWLSSETMERYYWAVVAWQVRSCTLFLPQPGAGVPAANPWEPAVKVDYTRSYGNCPCDWNRSYDNDP